MTVTSSVCSVQRLLTASGPRHSSRALDVSVGADDPPARAADATSGMVFVNIARKDGVVESVEANVVNISNDRGRHALGLSRALEVIRGSDGSPLPRGLADVAIGASVGAVGIRLKDGGFRATRIWTVD